MLGQVGKLGLLFRVQTMATGDSSSLRDPASENTAQGPARQPVRQRDCQPGAPVVEVVRDTSTGAANGGAGGNSGSSSGTLKTWWYYGLDSLPSVASGASIDPTGQSGTGSMTAAERADERLRRGYETFDGFILGERERAQNESNAAISSHRRWGGSGGAAGGQRQPRP